MKVAVGECPIAPPNGRLQFDTKKERPSREKKKRPYRGLSVGVIIGLKYQAINTIELNRRPTGKDNVISRMIFGGSQRSTTVIPVLV